MFYNFVSYLKIQFPTEKIYNNVIQQLSTQIQIPNRIVLIKESSGGETPWFQYVEKIIQIMCRDASITKARALAWSIYTHITSRFGLILPAVTVDSIVYPEIQTAQINGIQEPYCLGADQEGRYEFVNNYKVIYRRE